MQLELNILKEQILLDNQVVFCTKKRKHHFIWRGEFSIINKTSFLSSLIGKQRYLIIDDNEKLIGNLKLKGLRSLSLDISYQGNHIVEHVMLMRNFFTIQYSFQIASVKYILNKGRDKLILNCMGMPNDVEILMGCLILYFSHKIWRNDHTTDLGE